MESFEYFIALVAILLLGFLLWDAFAEPGWADPPGPSGPSAETLLSDPDPTAGPTVLVFTKTAGYRHRSIPDGVRMIRELGDEVGFTVAHTEDAAVFRDETLSEAAAVVFLSTTGDILDDEQQAAFERYIRGGGGFVGIHAAADTEYDWPWYGGLVGAWFRSHPRVQSGAIDVVDPDHPSTRMLPARWERRDEWYDFRDSPRDDVQVLLTLDEDSYRGGEMGDDHPIAWCHEYDGGRSWYTGGGHTRGSFREPLFRQHVAGGLRWAMGSVDAGSPLDAGTGETSEPDPG